LFGIGESGAILNKIVKTLLELEYLLILEISFLALSFFFKAHFLKCVDD
jgi:hypothetical protein